MILTTFDFLPEKRGRSKERGGSKERGRWRLSIDFGRSNRKTENDGQTKSAGVVPTSKSS